MFFLLLLLLLLKFLEAAVVGDVAMADDYIFI